jgi:hypothetical protein
MPPLSSHAPCTWTTIPDQKVGNRGLAEQVFIWYLAISPKSAEKPVLPILFLAKDICPCAQ